MRVKYCAGKQVRLQVSNWFADAADRLFRKQNLNYQ